jgi:hypothetical protein
MEAASNSSGSAVLAPYRRGVQSAANSEPTLASPIERLFGGALAVRVERAAQALDVSRSQIYEWVRTERLQAIRCSDGRRAGMRIIVDSIAKLLEGESQGGPTPAQRAALARTRQGGAAAWRSELRAKLATP